MTPPPPAPPPLPPLSTGPLPRRSTAARLTGGVGCLGLLAAAGLVVLIAAVFTAAIKLRGWWDLGPAVLILVFCYLYFRQRSQLAMFWRNALERHLADGRAQQAAHTWAAAIDHFEQAGPLAIRLHDQAAIAAAEAGRDACRAAEEKAIEHLAFLLYGLYAGREKALFRILHESVVNLTAVTVRDSDLEAVPSLPHLNRLQLRGRFVTDVTLAHAAHAHGLIELYLEDVAVTDGGLAQFRAGAWLPDSIEAEMGRNARAAALADGDAGSAPSHAAHHAHHAHHDGIEATGPAAAALAAAPGSETPDEAADRPVPREVNDLKFLHLEAAQITDAGLAHLAAFTALERLSLHRTKVTAAGIAHLAPLTRLRLLSVDGPGIDDGACAAIARLAGLERLELYATAVTGPGLEALAALPNLARLDLSRAPLTATAVSALKRLTGLKFLNLRETPLTADQVAGLKAALPECNVSA
ncbi:MAG: leucine-rich repeat domain-containing protein [Planctomycetota bacterium]